MGDDLPSNTVIIMSTVMKPTPADKRELNLNPKIKLPRERYTLRIKDEEFKISSNGNPMIVLTPELIAPDTFKGYDGATVNIAGIEVKKMYVTLQVKDQENPGKIDEAASQKAFDRYADMRTMLGVPIGDDGVDVQNPPKVFKGIVVDAICDGEENIRRKDPTPEQKARGEMGTPIMDDNNKPIMSYYPYIVEILGLASPDKVALASTRAF